jgi:oligoribonuclease (3'-5' exoribonuclease)
MKQPTTILIIDCATSGFSPERDHILEVCCILVDAATLDVLDTHNSVIRHNPADGVTAPDFHEALMRECAAETSNSLRAVEGFLCAGPWSTASILVDSTRNTFDIRFLQKHMPTFAAALLKNRPVLNLPALAMLREAHGWRPYASTNPKTYRAADDAMATYEELCHLVAAVAS